jgi:Mg-chelatase subunit ChlD
MNLFESGLSNVLGSKLEGEFPVTVRQIGVGDRSALGDGILNNMQGDDSLLLVSDGQSTHGRDFGDILRLAYDLNTTISAMNLVAQKSDASIQILGPDKQIEQLDTEFLVAVNKVGDPSCSITIKSDGNIVVQTSKLEDFTFNRRFGQGDHKLHAQMACQNDHFSANNQYFKTIQIVPKPKILYLAKEASPLDTSFTRYYRYERTPTMPSSLSSYQAVVINDFSAQELLPHTPLLQDYVAEGNGLVVVGGKNAYDQGGYKNSLLEAMLPVQVGTSDKSEEGSLNIIIVIDISGSTGSGFSSGGDSSKVDVEKSLAIDILKDIRVNDKVGVVAFNRQAYDVSPLTSLSEKRDITTKIARLQDSGGTEIFKGLRRASQMLAFVEGGKNIVIISDGETQFGPTVLSYADVLATGGIKIHAVGIGENQKHEFMQALARVGNGVYLKPSEHEQLKILFDNPEPGQKDRDSLTIVNSNHFITQELTLQAKLTGFNQVVAKQSARTLVTTFDGSTIVAEHRFGLGRIVSVATDDGTAWSGQLFKAPNSLLWTRMVNYAIGNPTRKSDFTVRMDDVQLGDVVTITVQSGQFPTHNLVTFSKVGENLYEGTFTPKSVGFYDFFGGSVGVSYPKEFTQVGVHDNLEGLVGSTGGQMFDLNDVEELKQFVQENSVRIQQTVRYWRWPFIMAALGLFIIQLFIRRYSKR